MLCKWYPKGPPERCWAFPVEFFGLISFTQLNFMHKRFWRETDKQLRSETEYPAGNKLCAR